MSENQTILDEAKSSLDRVQEFKPDDLVQKGRLGESSFDEAVEPAQRVISLFRQLPSATLDYLSDTELNVVKSQANSLYQMFQEVLAFDMNEGDVRNRQTQLVERLQSAYQGHFTKLYPLISYSMARTVNFGQLEDQGRAADRKSVV